MGRSTAKEVRQARSTVGITPTCIRGSSRGKLLTPPNDRLRGSLYAKPETHSNGLTSTTTACKTDGIGLYWVAHQLRSPVRDKCWGLNVQRVPQHESRRLREFVGACQIARRCSPLYSAMRHLKKRHGQCTDDPRATETSPCVKFPRPLPPPPPPH